MDVRIEPMTAADVPQVAELEKACFSDPWPESILSHELENELSLWLVAKSGDTVLGYIGSQSVLDEADMMNIAVRKDARRQGIAKKLLEVRDSNEAAIRLYEGFGFLQVGKRPNYYFHPKEDARILRKDGLA